MAVQNVTSLTITVQWGTVPCSKQNGEITGYLVTYGEVDSSPELVTGTVRIVENETTAYTVICESGSGSGNDGLVNMGSGSESERTNTTMYVSATDLRITLTGLRPSTNYSITVAAYNSAGFGLQSDLLFVKTNGE